MTEPTPIDLGACASHTGMRRPDNQDFFGWAQLSERVLLYAVADGMGGQQAGEIASRVAVESLLEDARSRFAGLDELSLPALTGLLSASFRAANNTVHDRARALCNNMGTTLVVALVFDAEHVLMANVGDSRGYLMRGRWLHRITRDHSLIAQWVEAGRLTWSEVRGHPHSNVLLRGVGLERDVDVDLFRTRLQPDDRLLLCSDGLWGEIDEEALRQILIDQRDPATSVRALVQAANDEGGSDNITALVVALPG